MKDIERKKQSSSIHQRIRNAKVLVKSIDKIERFKYLVRHSVFERLKCGLKNQLNKRRRFFNLLIQVPKLWISKINFNLFIQKIKLWMKTMDLKSMSHDSIFWICEAFVEGLTANFATHYLFGIDFSFAILMSHGIIIKQGLDIFSRIKTHGSSAKVQIKDK